MLFWIIAGDPLPPVSTFHGSTFSGSEYRQISYSTTDSDGHSSQTHTSHETDGSAGGATLESGSSSTQISRSDSNDYHGTSSSSSGATNDVAHAGVSASESYSLEEFSSSSFSSAQTIVDDGTIFSSIDLVATTHYYSSTARNAGELTSSSDPGSDLPLVTFHVTYSGSNSTEVSFVSTTSGSYSGENPTTPYFQTTAVVDVPHIFLTWVASTAVGSVWTTCSTTATAFSDGSTLTISSLTLTHVTSARSIHIAETTTTSSDEGEDSGTYTAVVPLTSSVNSTTVIVVATDDLTLGLANNTIVEASPCHALYSAGSVEGIKAFCEIFESIDRVELLPSFISTSSSSSSSDSFLSSTDVASDFSTHQSEWHASTFGSTKGFDQDFFTALDAPDRLSGVGFNLEVPMMSSGFQPYTALGVGDPLYLSYSIAIPPSVTEIGAILSRRQGSTFRRFSSITQVAPISSEDSLSMLGALGSESTLTMGGVGGFGGAMGDNSLTLYHGIFCISRYTPVGSSFASSTQELTVEDSQVQTIPRGEIWTVETLSAFSADAGWPFPARTAFMEIDCSTNAGLVIS